MKLFFTFFFSSFIFLWSCSSSSVDELNLEGDDELENCGPTVSLASDIEPIIERDCAISGCHLDRQSPLFDDKDAIVSSASRILARTSAGTMPPSGSLGRSDIDLIRCWVENGANNN